MLLNAEGGGVVGGGEGTRHKIRVLAQGDWRHLRGQQAPKHQYIVDDTHPGFRIVSGQWGGEVKVQHGYNDSQPQSEQATGPYYHHCTCTS